MNFESQISSRKSPPRVSRLNSPLSVFKMNREKKTKNKMSFLFRHRRRGERERGEEEKMNMQEQNFDLNLASQKE
jgi:hypothetical protein